MSETGQTESYKHLLKLSVIGAKKFGKQSFYKGGWIWEWVCRRSHDEFVHVRHDETDARFPTTMIYHNGLLVHRLDECDEALQILREQLLLDEFADI